MKDNNKKKVKMIALIIFILILILFLVIVLFVVNREEKKEYKLDEFYNVYPDDIGILYSYTNDISCTGAIHFDIELDGGKYLVSDWKLTDLLNYTFSYIDKYAALSDSINSNDFTRYTDKLFKGNIYDMHDVKNYQYDDYVYSFEKGKLKRKEKKCNSDIKYVSDLYGYSYSKDSLYVDVNMGYEKNGILYDLSNKELGKYSKDISLLRKMLEKTSYYRFIYINDNGTYKLNGVEWVNRV